MTPEFESVSLNRKALISFVCAILTLVSICAGFAPIPFTAIICYPASILLGILSLFFGVSAIREVKQSNESGRTIALVAAWVGGLSILATLCIIVLGVFLYPYVSDFIRQSVNQIRP